MDTTALPKKRAAESEGVPLDPKHVRLEYDGATILGLATEKELRERASEIWSTFTPKKNQGMMELDSLMKNWVASLVPDPTIDNVVEVLKFVQDNTVGAIVSGHKMGGKSQTLEFVEHLLRSYNCGVVKYSMKDTEGPDRCPSTSKMFLKDLIKGFLEKNDQLDIEAACRSLLKDVLENAPDIQYEEAKMLQQAKQHYYTGLGYGNPTGKAECGELAMVA